jgi:hypothetical protein
MERKFVWLVELLDGDPQEWELLSGWAHATRDKAREEMVAFRRKVFDSVKMRPVRFVRDDRKAAEE